MPRCRCKEDCTLELETGTPVVKVEFYGKPTPGMLVAIEHLAKSDEVNKLRVNHDKIADALGVGKD